MNAVWENLVVLNQFDLTYKTINWSLMLRFIAQSNDCLGELKTPYYAISLKITCSGGTSC